MTLSALVQRPTIPAAANVLSSTSNNGCPLKLTFAVDAGLTETNLAETNGLAFDTVRSLMREPAKGNVRTLEVLAWALKAPLVLVV